MDLFRAIGLTTPSIWQVARELAHAEHGLTINEAARRAGLGPTSVRKAAKRLAGLHINGNALCIVESPQHRGRGYQTHLICEHHQIAQFNRYSSRSHTPLTYDVKTFSVENKGHPPGDARDDRSSDEVNGQRQRPTSRIERQDTLDALSDDVVVVRGARYWRYAAERVRTLAWERGASRECAQVIGSVILSNVTGQPLREFRRYVAVLQDEHAATELVERVEWVLANRDRNAAYAAARAVLNRQLQGKRGVTQQPVDDGGYNLATVEGRQRFRQFIEDNATSGMWWFDCPRCGGNITRELWEDEDIDESWRPFDPYERYDDECSCIYILRARERGTQRDPSKSPALSAVLLKANQGRQRGAPYDLDDPVERRNYLARAGEIAADGGGECPICRKRITTAVWEDAGAAYDGDGLCKCVYAARMKAADGVGVQREDDDAPSWLASDILPEITAAESKWEREEHERHRAHSHVDAWTQARDEAARRGEYLDYAQWSAECGEVGFGLSKPTQRQRPRQRNLQHSPAQPRKAEHSQDEIQSYIDKLRAEMRQNGKTEADIQAAVQGVLRSVEVAHDLPD